MNSKENIHVCEEMRRYIDGTLRADVYLATQWRWFVSYLPYSEDEIRSCLPFLGVEVRDGVVFLWSREYYGKLIDAVVDMARREKDASVVADLYRERKL
jgi:hypothetical protein